MSSINTLPFPSSYKHLKVLRTRASQLISLTWKTKPPGRKGAQFKHTRGTPQEVHWGYDSRCRGQSQQGRTRAGTSTPSAMPPCQLYARAQRLRGLQGSALPTPSAWFPASPGAHTCIPSPQARKSLAV